jgi:8-oxo-dGTP pyrophosphatase MutT (NUDIX family)
MAEKYSIKDGRIEAVMWIVYRDDKIVIEKRPPHPTKATVCIPAGHIDLNQDKGKDYIEQAMLREAKEEFSLGDFTPTKWKYLKAIDFEEQERDKSITKLRLHYFVITDWTGTVPKHTIENKGKHADLVWFPISDYKKLPQACDVKALELLIKKL